MHRFVLASFAALPLVAQDPPSQPKIPRPPSLGIPKSVEPLPTKNGVPATLGLLVPDEPVQRPRQVEHPEVVAAATDAITRQFADPEFLVVDEAPDGTVWAAGGNFKAAFAADGWRFFGRPAATAPTLQPIVFALTDVRVGGAPIGLAAPERVHAERHLEYRRGGVVEALDVSGRGVEQTFVFAQLPQRGELVLHVAATTALTGGAAGDGIVFRGEFDEVRYSGAIAIDAHGERIAAPTSFADGVITIRVPAEFVAHAALPLRIDPLVSSVTVYPSTNDVGDPDIAWDETGQVWAVSFMRYFGGTDWDCYVQRLSLGSSMALVGTLTTIDVSGSTWQRPRIANLGVYDEFMVVCQTKNGSSPWAISGRIMANSGAIVTNQFVVASSSVDELHPDIGGDSEAPPTYFTVVWEHGFSATDHDIYARQVEATGTLRGVGATIVQANVINQTWPSISKCDGASPFSSQRFAIVYQETFSASDEDIYGAMLTWDGVFVPVAGNNTFLIDASVAYDTFPSISSPTLLGSNGLRYLLAAWERNSNNGDIVGICFDQAGNYRASGNITALEGNPTRLTWPQARPSVDTDGMRFVVGYHEVFGNNPTVNDLDTRVTTVAFAGGNLIAEEAGVTLGFSGNREFNVQVASRYSGLGAYSPNCNTANDHDGIAGGGFAIDAFAFDAAPAGFFATRSTACGSLGIFANGQAIPGGLVAFAQTSQPFLSGFVLGGATSVPVGPCPGCTLGVDGFLALGASYAVAVPLDPAMVGVSFSAQGFVFQPSGAPCINQIQLSDTIDVTIG